MGWCSGTDVFDSIVSELLKKKPNRLEIIKALIKALWYQDWDCELDSCYYDHPLVRKAFKELGK